MVYQQIVGIPMGTNCAPLIADLFLYCCERDFMSNLQKSKRFELKDKFNDTSRYLDDIFTIDNPTFVEHIPDIYPRELQLNKANTSDKETSFMDLNIKGAKEKYRGVFEIQKSGDKTSSGEIGLDIRTHASPKVGQDQVSGGVSVLCWHAAPVAYVLWKPCTIR